MSSSTAPRDHGEPGSDEPGNSDFDTAVLDKDGDPIRRPGEPGYDVLVDVLPEDEPQTEEIPVLDPAAGAEDNPVNVAALAEAAKAQQMLQASANCGDHAEGDAAWMH